MRLPKEVTAHRSKTTRLGFCKHAVVANFSRSSENQNTDKGAPSED